jgi:ABC-type transport system involved in multi-copper enzyme maturation permease subunit
MATKRNVPTPGEAIGIMAGLTVKRLVRGRVVWFMLLAAGLPSLIGLAMRGGDHADQPLRVANATLDIVQFLFAIMAPILVGSAVGDELGNKTATYLWSRPIPRWTILVGKLVVLGPVSALLLMASWLVALVLGGGMISAQGLAAVAFGGLAVSCVVAAIAAIGPRQAIAFSLVYVLLIDLPIGAIPASIRVFSVTHQTGVLTALPDASGPATGSPVAAVIWMTAMAAVWLTVAFQLLRSREA